MKKATFIISLLLVTVFFTGHYFIYKSVLKSHKKEFKTYIRSHFAKHEQLEINPSELYSDNGKIRWLDENKEICLNGVMFDIISISNSGTKVILEVVNDKHEKELMDRYQNDFNETYNTGNTGKKNNHLIKDFLSLRFFQKNYSQIKIFSCNYDYLKDNKSKTVNGYMTVLTPPPLS